DNPLSVAGRGNGPGGVGAMPVVVVPGRRRGVGSPADARRAVGEVDVGFEVGVLEVHAGVDVADEHRAAATRDFVRFRGVDLFHVPLQTRQTVVVCGGSASGCIWTLAVVRNSILQAHHCLGGFARVVDATVLANVVTGGRAR